MNNLKPKKELSLIYSEKSNMVMKLRGGKQWKN